MDIIEYLDAVKTRHDLTSDYKLAKILEISLSRMSAYRNGKNTLGEDICLKVAKLLNLAPSQVLIDIFAERTKFPKAAKILHQAAKQIGSAAASLLLTLSMIYSMSSPTSAAASAYVNQNSGLADNIYYAELHRVYYGR